MQAIDIIVGFPMPVPLLARPVRAGFPSPADDFIEEEVVGPFEISAAQIFSEAAAMRSQASR